MCAQQNCDSTPGRSQQLLVAAALAYAGSAAFASVVAVRDDVPGRPLGITVPLSVTAGIAAGWGAGIAPPWYMPALAVIAARRAGASGSTTGVMIAGSIGVASIMGHLIEPVTWRPGSWTPGTRASIAMTMGSSALLASVALTRCRAGGAAA